MKLLVSAAFALLLSGCSALPRISFQTQYGTFSYELPEPTALKK